MEVELAKLLSCVCVCAFFFQLPICNLTIAQEFKELQGICVDAFQHEEKQGQKSKAVMAINCKSSWRTSLCNILQAAWKL